MPLIAERPAFTDSSATAGESMSPSANGGLESGNGNGHRGVRSRLDTILPGLVHLTLSQSVTEQRQRASETGGSPSGSTQDTLIEALTWLYSVGDYASVIGFLRKNPIAVPVLLIARSVIEMFFGQDVKVTVDQAFDPEAKGESELVVRIFSNYPPLEAAMKLADFDRYWWLAASYETKTRLSITLGYQ